jgi:hypothetical protein
MRSCSPLPLFASIVGSVCSALSSTPPSSNCPLTFPLTGHRSPELPDCPVLLSFGIFQRFRSQSEFGSFRYVALAIGEASLQHTKALNDSGVQAFVPYTLRHTALTMLWHSRPRRWVDVGAHRWAFLDHCNSAVHPPPGRSNPARVHSVAIAGRHKTRHNQKKAQGGTEQENSIKPNVYAGAGRGSRTPKGQSPADFESAASASSAIPALRGSDLFYNLLSVSILSSPQQEMRNV